MIAQNQCGGFAIITLERIAEREQMIQSEKQQQRRSYCRISVERQYFRFFALFFVRNFLLNRREVFGHIGLGKRNGLQREFQFPVGVEIGFGHQSL